MDEQTADVVVIGMGPGGEDVAGRLAEAGLDVIGIDRELVGGECPYWGCIPSKMMIRSAHLLAEARRIPGMAGTATVTPDFGDRVITARRGIVVATGTSAAIPPIDGLADVDFWTNREAIEAKELPASMVVLGGGAIGVELAQSFARFGTTVTVVEAADRLVPMEEPEAGALLAEILSGEGIEVRTDTTVTRASSIPDGTRVELDDGETVDAARLLVATGRRADLTAVGLGTAGIDDLQRWVPVDGHQRVTDGIWAVGDITGKGAFTHVAMYQSAIAVADILGHDHAPAQYHALPRATFTDPEIGSVGRTEAQAREAGIDVAVGFTKVPHTARGWLHKAGNDGFIKLVADTERDVLVGATAMGPSGGEVLGLLTLAVHAEIPIATLRQMIFAYPTFHKGIEDALRSLAA